MTAACADARRPGEGKCAMRELANVRVTDRVGGARRFELRRLVGSGERIGLLVAPFLLVGIALNVWRPELFALGGLAPALRVAAIVMLVPGLVAWLWSVELILTRVPRHELITGGPYALAKHPLYTGVGLLVLPAVGFLLNSWLGLVVGLVVYAGSRMYAPAEERALAEEFGPAWDAYMAAVKAPWL